MGGTRPRQTASRIDLRGYFSDSGQQDTLRRSMANSALQSRGTPGALRQNAHLPRGKGDTLDVC